ncbi:hypothetical protein SLS53_004932 [Cytospora paraplurivora]|uniref:Transcription factor domain-containing protein n=1 Tax=Cytospora paraplurivora TaxID=2898453 RepID=A0AAN9YFX3_9PEZI
MIRLEDACSSGRRPQKRDGDAFAEEPAQDPELELSRGLSRLGYAPDSGTLSFTREALSLSTEKHDHNFNEGSSAQSEDIRDALRSVLPKLYSDLLVQNFLEIANYQYYTCFPAQLQNQCAEWWGDRADGRRLSPEFTCLLLQVCASSTQFLEENLRNRFESELGEKAQTLTERFHAAALKLSAAIPPGKVKDPIIMVQQLFLHAVWFKYEAKMIEAWHALGTAIRAAQESEGNADSEVPTPIASVAYQAQIGVVIYPLFQQLARDNSVDLTMKIEREVEQWMDTFPPVLRDVRPNRDWDEKYPYVPLLRCQLNVVAYSFLLGPLKPYLIGAADPNVKGTQAERDLRAKGVDVCLDLLDAAERFYKLIYPASVKYFFILFFIFDGATVLCSAIAHDDKDRPSLPRRDRIVLALKNSLLLLEGVSHLSKTAVISAAALKKLMAILTLTAQENIILGLDLGGPSKRARMGSVSPTAGSSSISGSVADPSTTLHGSEGGPQLAPRPPPPLSPLHGGLLPTHRSVELGKDIAWHSNPAKMPETGSGTPGPSGHSLSPAMQQQQIGEPMSMPMTGSDVSSTPLGHLEDLWDWGNLNMDFTGNPPLSG